MRYTKPALKYEDQLSLILSRGLTVPDKERALRWLRRIGYYRLSAYFLPFKTTGRDEFRPGSTFDEVIDLYKFDCRLRLLFMQAIDRVEVGIRAMITYELAHQLGPDGYSNESNFAPSYDHKDFMRLLAHEEKRGSEVFVKHFRTKYTTEPHLPIWMATELVSFGTLSKMTESLRASLRKHLAKEFGLAEPVFISWMHTIAYVRNVCAHHNRLWNRELGVKPILPNDWSSAGVPNDRVYCVALMLQYFLGYVAPNTQWKERLKQNFSEHRTVDLAAMQFPPNWQESSPWK